MEDHAPNLTFRGSRGSEDSGAGPPALRPTPRFH